MSPKPRADADRDSRKIDAGRLYLYACRYLISHGYRDHSKGVPYDRNGVTEKNKGGVWL